MNGIIPIAGYQPPQTGDGSPLPYARGLIMGALITTTTTTTSSTMGSTGLMERRDLG